MKHSLLAVLISVTTLSGCVTLPGTNKKAFIMTSLAEENKMGDEAYKQILATEKRSNDARITAMLKRVGERIAKQVPVEFQWEFTLIESKEMNAFCLPGGKVAFYTGILPVLENEAAMALVMGHEVAHAVLRHGGQRMTQGLIVQGGLAAISATLLKDSKWRNETVGLLGAGAAVGVILPFSRSNETEADGEGIKYAAAAGYDPAEGPRFWARFAKAVGKGGKPPQFLSTHPADESRIKNLEQLQSQAQSLYQQSPKYGLGEKI